MLNARQIRFLFALSLFFTASWGRAAEVSGAQIYTEMCARCHGPNGEGVAEKHDEPLYGDRTLKSLTRLIQRTMPEDTETKCTPEEAQKVAEYIFDAFYSPAARARLMPPKIDFARLTVRQYQNAVADLVGSFRDDPEIGPQRGLEGEYYASRNFKRDTKAAERVDPRIRFEFGASAPEVELTGTNTIAHDEFSIRWRGSILAEETGEYEFRLRTENGARLYLNDERKPLIDAWVSSANEPREHQETIRLLGGRAYPIQVDLFKFKEKTASLVLEWKPPHKTWEVVPERNLTPTPVGETLVVTTAFPPDDSSAGYPRGTTVSKGWDQATTYAAIDVAAQVIEKLDSLAGTRKDADNREEKIKAFCAKFAERAFRRPLSDEQKEMYVEAQFESAGDLENAVKRVVILVLKSPRFLYPELKGSGPDDYDVASRLSFALWDSIPDRELLEAAAQGNLRTESQAAAQAKRMLKDPRTKTKLHEFFEHWLEMEEAEDVSKDPEAFPDFTDSILADLRTSLRLFIDETVWSDTSDYRQLLLANYVFLNPRLAKFYGAKGVAASTLAVQLTQDEGAQPGSGAGDSEESEEALSKPGEFEKYFFDPNERAGVLTHPYLLTALAYYRSSSPIHRGVFLTRNIVGRSLKPPPAAIQFMDGRFDPGMSMRQKVTELTSPAACQGCHQIINPLGFSLENFDGVGRFRTIDNGTPVDATSDYRTTDGELITFRNARDVANHAAASEEAHRAFVRQVFQHLVKQPVPAYGPDKLEELRSAFAERNFSVQQLLIEIVKVSALHGSDQNQTMASNQGRNG